MTYSPLAEPSSAHSYPAHEIVPLDRLKPAKRNARLHAKAQIAALVESMRKFALITPIVVDRDYRIVAGHGRWEAAKQLGLTRVAVLRVEHLSEAELRAYAIADNRIAERGEWDHKILAVEFRELEVELPEISLSVTGFELPQIELMTAALDQTDWTDLDRTPEPQPEANPTTRAGDQWVFEDKHQLVSGDSTDPAIVAELLNGDQVRLIATDPPYNLPARDYSGNGRRKPRNFKMAAGELSRDGFSDFLGGALGSVLPHLHPGALAYIFMDWKHVRELLWAADANALELLNICIWDKGKGGMGSFYRSAHEMVFVFKHGDEPHRNRVELGRHGRNRTNLWRYEGFNSFSRGRDRALAMHATVKPVQMICDMLLDATDKGDIIFDGFGGSGTTLIAAERLGRRARVIELDPVYCDTIIERYSAAFGTEPVHRALGKTFSEVREIRRSADALP